MKMILLACACGGCCFFCSVRRDTAPGALFADSVFGWTFPKTSSFLATASTTVLLLVISLRMDDDVLLDDLLPPDTFSTLLETTAGVSSSLSSSWGFSKVSITVVNSSSLIMLTFFTNGVIFCFRSPPDVRKYRTLLFEGIVPWFPFLVSDTHRHGMNNWYLTSNTSFLFLMIYSLLSKSL